jgi:hypothetical protein
VLQRLTVLLSYQFDASVPLLRAALKWKMTSVRGSLIVVRGAVPMTSAFATWIGQAVVLQVATGDLRVPLRGVIVGESDGAVRFRIGEGWDIDIYKPMILAVEQDNWAAILAN